MQQGVDLTGIGFRSGALDHRDQTRHEFHGSTAVAGHHRRQPFGRERRHAAPVCQPQQTAAALRFAVADRVHAGIEQGEAGNPLRRRAQHLERNPAAHGMSRDREALGGHRQHMLCHGGYRRESSKRHDAHIRSIPEALRDVGPNGFIA
jgi:hypothetical protein